MIKQVLAIVKDLKVSINKLNETVTALDNKVHHLWKYNNMDVSIEYPPLTYSKSPIQLNTIGEKILETYKGKKAIEANKENFINEIHKIGIKSPLDVQNIAEQMILYNFHKDEFIEVRNMIYQHPTFENQQVNAKVMSILMGLYLRNMYFDKHSSLLENLPKELVL